ncbi:hypothetical protein CDAR_12391 [Caerostris darwini]|uniref:Uncharacterized protein n=1 Tax=Caerostris darwini TaxID=1538125 RepID=A0AAV4V2H5_9ARAC|nr:hypothetical protein CDAR_12391 [Caerostris darwini]
MLEKTDISYLHLCPNNPPREVIIMNENGENLQGIIGPYNEGSSLTLFCEADQEMCLIYFVRHYEFWDLV